MSDVRRHIQPLSHWANCFCEPPFFLNPCFHHPYRKLSRARREYGRESRGWREYTTLRLAAITWNVGEVETIVLKAFVIKDRVKELHQGWTVSPEYASIIQGFWMQEPLRLFSSSPYPTRQYALSGTRTYLLLGINCWELRDYWLDAWSFWGGLTFRFVDKSCGYCHMQMKELRYGADKSMYAKPE